MYKKITKEDYIEVLKYSNVVSSTFGPRGNTVVISADGIPHVTKDGVTVSNSIHIDNNPVANELVKLAKEAARKTCDAVGDGTTSTTIIMSGLIEAYNNLSIADKKAINFRELSKYLDILGDECTSWVNKSKTKLTKDSKHIRNIASISSNQDELVTDLVTKATESAGVHGTVDVELVEKDTSSVKVIGGSHLVSNIVCIPDVTGMFSNKCKIILVEGSISKLHEIEEVQRGALRLTQEQQITTVIIAKDFSKDVIQTCAINNNAGRTSTILAVAEGFGSGRLQVLKDMGSIFNSPVYSTDGSTNLALSELSLVEVTNSSWGMCDEVVATSRDLIFKRPSQFNDTEISESIKLMEKNLDNGVLGSAVRNIISLRRSKIANVATIEVGGLTQASRDELKDRVDDAVAAVASAISHGILPGGGASWMKLHDHVGRFLNTKSESRKYAVKSLQHAISKLLSKLYNDEDYTDIKNKISVNDSVDLSGDTPRIINISQGIVDPSDILIHSIKNAIAVFKVICLSEYVIYGEDQ